MGIFDKITNALGIENEEINMPSNLRIQKLNQTTDIAIDYITGKKHEAYLEECEDYASYKNSADKVTMAVSDGCSAAKEAKTAAEVSVQFALDYLQKQDWESMNIEELVNDFVDGIQTYLLASEKQYPELSSTLVVLSYNKTTHNYISINIGDGFLRKYYEKNYSTDVVLTPYNRDNNPARTCFGNSFDVKEHIQAVTGNIVSEQIFGFVIASDGAEILNTNEEYGDKTLKSLALALRNQNGNYIQQKVKELQNHTHDDISIGVLLVTPENNSSDVVEDTKEPESFELNNEVDVEVKTKFDIDEVTEKILEKKVSIPAQYAALIMANLNEEDGGLSMANLINNQICKRNTVLRTMIPLIRCSLVIFKDGKFVYNR